METDNAHVLSQGTLEHTFSSDSRLADNLHNGDNGRNACDKLPSLERYFSQIECCVQELRKDMKVIVATIDRKAQLTRESRRCCSDWREVSRVLDRFFVIVYLATIISSLLTLFPRPLMEQE